MKLIYTDQSNNHQFTTILSSTWLVYLNTHTRTLYEHLTKRSNKLRRVGGCGVRIRDSQSADVNSFIVQLWAHCD